MKTPPPPYTTLNEAIRQVLTLASTAPLLTTEAAVDTKAAIKLYEKAVTAYQNVLSGAGELARLYREFKNQVAMAAKTDTALRSFKEDLHAMDDRSMDDSEDFLRDLIPALQYFCQEQIQYCHERIEAWYQYIAANTLDV